MFVYTVPGNSLDMLLGRGGGGGGELGQSLVEPF
jgi:hypothetical protein